MWHETAISRALAIRFPVLLGPFGAGMSSEGLVALVSEAGGLGIYGANALSPERIRQVAARLRQLTSQPFGFNLWVPTPGQPVSEAPGYEAARERLAPYFAEFGLPLPQRPGRFSELYDDQVEAMLAARPAVFSFVYGIPGPDILAECRRRDILTIGTATTADEAQAIEKAGVDMVVASGFEGGGHRGSFLTEPEEVLTGLFSLLPQIADRVAIPVIAAGGIADGRGIAAALALGAAGVQVGTAFLACAESGMSPAYRAALFSDEARDTCLTRAFTGRLARAIRNRFTDAMAADPGALAPYPVQSWLTGQIRAAARDQGRTDLLNLWAGQSAALLRHRSAGPLFEALIAETTAVFARAGRRS